LDRRCALTLLNTAWLIPPSDALLQIASPVDELCRWALLSNPDGAAPTQLVHLVRSLFDRSRVSMTTFENAYHALTDMEHALANREDAAQLHERIEALCSCMSIDFRSARYGHTLSLQGEAHSVPRNHHARVNRTDSEERPRRARSDARLRRY
jgi:hypothetical protein